MSNKYSLVIISSSWGEIDWLLPYIYFRKSFNERFVYFFKSDYLFKKRKYYNDLYKLSDKIFDDIITPKSLFTKLGWKIFYFTLKDILKKKKNKKYLSFLIIKIKPCQKYNEKSYKIEKIYVELGFMKNYKTLEFFNEKNIFYFLMHKLFEALSF